MTKSKMEEKKLPTIPINYEVLSSKILNSDCRIQHKQKEIQGSKELLAIFSYGASIAL